MCRVVLTVEDVNDNSPLFEELTALVTLMDTSTPVGRKFYIASASDADLGLNSKVTYSINLGEYLNIDKDTGVVSVVTLLTEGTTTAVITAKDSGSPSRSSAMNLVVRVLSEDELYQCGIN